MPTAKLVTINGSAKPHTRMAIFVDGADEPAFTTTADVAGNFVGTCELAEGEHEIVATGSLEGLREASARTSITVEAEEDGAGTLPLSERLERELLYAEWQPYTHISADPAARELVFAGSRAVGNYENLRDYIVRNGAEAVNADKADRICAAAGKTPEDLFESVRAILAEEQAAEFSDAVAQLRRERDRLKFQQFRQKLAAIA